MYVMHTSTVRVVLCFSVYSSRGCVVIVQAIPLCLQYELVARLLLHISLIQNNEVGLLIYRAACNLNLGKQNSYLVK